MRSFNHSWLPPQAPHSSSCPMSSLLLPLQIESMSNDFVQLEHLHNVVEDLSGSLLSGTLDPALLRVRVSSITLGRGRAAEGAKQGWGV